MKWGSLVPVVYVIFNEIPGYLWCNIEVALRKNPVVVLGDDSALRTVRIQQNQRDSLPLLVERSEHYMSSARAFARIYKHMAGKDNSPARIRRELQNFQRWFLVRDFLRAQGISQVFFSDGDSTVYGNVTQAHLDREQCAAVINVEYQPGVLHWVAAGEASLWSIQAMESFCNFTMAVYESRSAVDAMQIKNNIKPAVVDMSLLWLWWTNNKSLNDTSWIVHRPPAPVPVPIPASSSLDSAASPSQLSWTKNYIAFRYAKSLRLPNVTTVLSLCNGLDVVKSTVFDHMHAWKTNLKDFALGEMPSTMAERSMHGGRAENATLPAGKLSFLNVHYQGNSKGWLIYDACQVLTTTGTRTISLTLVHSLCQKELKKRPHGYIVHG